MLRVCRHANAREFLTRAEPWLARAADRARGCALASAAARECRTIRVTRSRSYWATIEDDSRIVGYAFRTPPYRLGVSALPDRGDCRARRRRRRALSVVVRASAAPSPPRACLPRAWTEKHGGSWQRAIGPATVRVASARGARLESVWSSAARRRRRRSRSRRIGARRTRATAASRRSMDASARASSATGSCTSGTTADRAAC